MDDTQEEYLEMEDQEASPENAQGADKPTTDSESVPEGGGSQEGGAGSGTGGGSQGEGGGASQGGGSQGEGGGASQGGGTGNATGTGEGQGS